jgi:hypothetical protein
MIKAGKKARMLATNVLTFGDLFLRAAMARVSVNKKAPDLADRGQVEEGNVEV